ncbi:VanW family protein [Bacillus sp. B15-48]|uniref:VanW family protein n=1 Tax=Bacillus sp. B15-48 TaxID=1548601 RepID=UPI00193F63D3|nr:VanW family protein [Bacillus sp. B15-48]MBM4762821.1 hypothetical protein [Bacillus sp. B15-48]
MGKQIGCLIFFVCSSLFVLAACSDQTLKKAEVEGELSAQTVVAGDKNKGELTENEEEEVPLGPISVHVVDPTTKDVIRTIYPEEMGFATEAEQYKMELKNWAKVLARGTDSVQGYDQRNLPDRLDEYGHVIKGQPQVMLEEAELVNEIIEYSEKGGVVELPLYINSSGYLKEDVAHLDEVVVASYTTYFDPNITGRNKNIELSAQAIDGVIVGIDDHFSFNTTVGPSDEEHGYQPAQEAVNGKLVMGIGGGICQTSSTLFNAVDQLGVDYVEWHHHSVTVGYVPAGRDATVSYGGKDFRFLNKSGAPFLIRTNYQNGSLTVEIRTAKQYEGVVKKKV